MEHAVLPTEDQAQFSSMLHGALEGRYAVVIDARSQREYADDHLSSRGLEPPVEFSPLHFVANQSTKF